MLARREHSHTELLQKLIKKGYNKAFIQEELNQLQQEGLLNHNRFIENYIHFRKGKGFGPLRIQAELLQKGLEQELIDQFLDLADNVWQDEITKLWRKRFKEKKPQDYKSRVLQMRFLSYRGFTQEQIELLFEE